MPDRINYVRRYVGGPKPVTLRYGARTRHQDQPTLTWSIGFGFRRDDLQSGRQLVGDDRRLGIGIGALPTFGRGDRHQFVAHGLTQQRKRSQATGSVKRPARHDTLGRHVFVDRPARLFQCLGLGVGKVVAHR